LCRRHLQLLIYASLQVLIQKRLQLLVLLVQESGLLDQVLALSQHLVVAQETLVQRPPDRQFLRRQNRSQLLPENLLFLLVSFGFDLLRLKVSFFLSLNTHQLLLNSQILLIMVILLQS
jgi:hypothetical protein